MDQEELIQELPTALLRWYSFALDARLLYVGRNDDAMGKMLLSRQQFHTIIVPWEKLSEIQGAFDYIICDGAFLEKNETPETILKDMRERLALRGLLLFGVHNRLGLRYFCGERDPYTEQNFDGIEGYRRLTLNKKGAFRGRIYSRAEIERMLSEAGFKIWKFSSVLPGLENPVFLYAEGYQPNEDLCNRLFPMYESPSTIFLEEVPLYQTLIDNGLFHAMANAYFVECTVAGDVSDMLQVTSSLERGRDNAMITVIHANKTVTKQPAYPEGAQRLHRMMQNTAKLQSRGIPVIEMKWEKDALSMPYVEEDTGQLFLKKLLLQNKDAFLDKMDQLRDIILSSSDSYVGAYPPRQQETSCANTSNLPEEGSTKLLRHACLDLVPLNSFYINGQFVFFDQEFSEENYPANVLLTRLVASFYAGNPELNAILPADTLYARYGLLEEKDRWLKYERDFLRQLRNLGTLSEYYNHARPTAATLYANRHRMNFSDEEYQRIFVDALENIGTRKLVLFGSGRFAQRFLDMYGQEYPIYAIVDNSESRWGETLAGVEITSPESLKDLLPGEYQILVCVRDYMPVLHQLDAMGLLAYGVFEPERMYRRRRNPVTYAEQAVTKKYHVGYIAGVFDLFHIGHLNLLRRAKEQCDYLLVGVVSDRGVREVKKVEPFIPFEERVAMVESCRYVDEAVEIPFGHHDTEDAWRMHHFDVQFSGSDYEHDARWLEKKAFLEAHGAEMVFFPYTESTSSTRLKKLIEKKLL